MIKKLITFLLFAQSAYGIGPFSDQNTVNFMHAKGSSSDGICTSFFTHFQKKLRHITAGHCFDEYESFTVYTGSNGVTRKTERETYYIIGEMVFSPFWADGSTSVNIENYNNSFNLHEDKLKFSDHNDVTYQELGFFSSYQASGMNVLNVASELPQIGDVLSLSGFSGGEGPLVRRCIFEGISLTPFSYKKINRPQVSFICRDIPSEDDVLSAGASGGPATNSLGEVVGVLTETSNDGGTLYHISPLIETPPKEVDTLPYKLLLSNGRMFEVISSKILYSKNKPIRACLKIQSKGPDSQVYYLGVNDEGHLDFQKNLYVVML